MRLCILTGTRNHALCWGVATLLTDFPEAQVLLVEHAPRRNARRLLRNQWINLKKHGWRWIPYESGYLLAGLAARFESKPRDLGVRPGGSLTWEAIVGNDRVRHIAASDIHASECLDQVRSFRPDLGISIAAPILRPALFGIPRLGTINLHKGKLPQYRGMPVAFWELYHGEAEVGCTIHRVDAGLDTGEILLEAAVRRSKFSTVRSLQLELDALGVRLTSAAVRQLADGSARGRPQQGTGKTFRKPSLRTAAVMDRKLRSLRPRSQESAAKRALKRAAVGAYVHLLRPLPRRWRSWRGNQRIVVLLYHRVSDELHDRVTVGLEAFDAQMAFLSRRYPLVSMEQVTKGEVPRDTKRPLVAVTFDDGYLDNYANAMPILLRHRVPATFYVCTGIVDSDRAFQHDLDKLGMALPTMTWRQIREMHAAGFTIGSHTANHVNMAKADAVTARGELVESLAKLRTELGLRDVLFAYPFGKRTDMTPERLETVKEVGYAGCCSAYGGVNDGRIEPFNVLRSGVSAFLDHATFKATLEGW